MSRTPVLSYLFTSLFLWLCAACDGPTNNRELLKVRVDSLEAEILSRHPVIGMPVRIQPWGKRLVVADAAGDPELHFLDATTGRLLVSSGRQGDGPKEFAGPVAGIQVPPHDAGALWAFDASGRKLMRIDESGVVGLGAPSVNLRGVPFVLAASWLDSLTIVSVNRQPEEERFVFFDREGNISRVVPGLLLGGGYDPNGTASEGQSELRVLPASDGKGICDCVLGSGTCGYL